MALTFLDPKSGERKPFAARAPGRIAVELSPRAERRAVIVAAAFRRAMAYLGHAPEEGNEIRVGGASAGGAKVWLKVAPIRGMPKDFESQCATRGFLGEDFEFLCLLVHYARPIDFDWAAMAVAQGQRKVLVDAHKLLGSGGLEPSSQGRAGYLHRFRECLSRDLDLPGAAACVGDGLKPGALSPGSRAALLNETIPVLFAQ